MNLKAEILACEPKVQRDLADKVQSIFALRSDSKRQIDLAKHFVETAMEQGEDFALSTIATGKGN